MTRDQKAALRAEARERRRRPSEDEQPNGDEPKQKETRAQEDGEREERPRGKREPPRGAGGDEFGQIATQARELLRSVRGVEAESVSGIGRTSANGWKVTLEVVELRRIPESTDVLASYEVELDEKGQFLGFSRGRRYNRSQAEDGAGR
jgi:gas vesicle protein GvpO